jgi:hypothetical protein
MMGRMGGPGGGGISGLLRNPQIQEELKLSDEQKEQLQQVAQEAFADMRDFFPSREDMQDLSEEDRRAKMQEAMEKAAKEREKRAPEIEKKIKGILKGDQFKRVNQIQLQVMGVDALTRADVAQALGLSEDQQSQIKEALEARDKERQAMFEEMRGSGGGGFRGFQDMSEEERTAMRERMQKSREKGEAITSEAQKAVMGKLTDDQKTKLRDLMGERFEFRRPEGGRFGGGRPGERRQGEGRDGGRREGGRRRPRPSET